MPTGRSRQPQTNTRKCDIQPAHQSLQTVVSAALSPALRNNHLPVNSEIIGDCLLMPKRYGQRTSEFVILPAEPVYCRPTPHDVRPCLRNPVSSTTRTASSAAKCSTTYSRTTSRKASASHRPPPNRACCRQGPGSPAASARIHPVLRGSLPSSTSKKSPADAATRSCVNKGRRRPFTSRSEHAQSSSVSSTDAPPLIMS
jgi:hypothetical protein